MERIERLTEATRPWIGGFGCETTMIFHEGFDLPHFAAFPLATSDEGKAALRRMAKRGIEQARAGGTGFVLDAETWRANMGWAPAMGLSEAEIRAANRDAVMLAREIRDEAARGTPILIAGTIGPLGDGYDASAAPSAEEAEALHRPQAEALAQAGVDFACAMTMTSVAEATGMARAVLATGSPLVVSFTVETDGRLPSGEGLGEAIVAVDEATGGAPLFYGINCAHPDHFADVLHGDWTARIGLIRANASRMSHEELDATEELDDGDPEEFGALSAALVERLPNLRIVGGCCGSDHRHLGCVAERLAA